MHHRLNNAVLKDAKRKSNPASVAKAYEPTPREPEALEACLVRRKKRKPAPRLTVTDAKGVAQIEVDHPEIGLAQLLLMVAIGTVNSDFFDGLISQLANVGTRGRGADEPA